MAGSTEESADGEFDLQCKVGGRANAPGQGSGSYDAVEPRREKYRDPGLMNVLARSPGAARTG